MPGPNELGLGEIANQCGLTYGTVKNYSATGRLPDPDLIKESGRKVWFPETIDEWQATRRRR
jgi:hypothetical protein